MEPLAARIIHSARIESELVGRELRFHLDTFAAEHWHSGLECEFYVVRKANEPNSYIVDFYAHGMDPAIGAALAARGE